MNAVRIRTLACVLIASSLPTAGADLNTGALPGLIELLRSRDDAQFRLDILHGMNQAFEGRSRVPMPEGWAEIESALLNQSSEEIRFLTRNLSVKFGSERALEHMRMTLKDASAQIQDRRAALNSLSAARDPGLPEVLLELLQDPELRGEALRSLSAFDHPGAARSILSVYSELTGAEKRSALNTLASRKGHALELLSAVKEERVPLRDLTAELVRQLKRFNDPEMDRQIQDIWGIYQESTADKQQEIERYRGIYRAGGSTPGDAARGRVVYARICQQCHTLFDVGGSVGPDLTGSNRTDLDYLLQNIVDPNAVIPNEYRPVTVETKDDRVLTGILKSQTRESVAIQTADQVHNVAREKIEDLQQEEMSMMPEGLMAALNDQEARDLLYYLRGPAQAPLVLTRDTADLFFNGVDLGNWSGNFDLWSVEDGEIVGRAPQGLEQNEFLKSQMIVGNFRLICEIRLTPNEANSGIQFRGESEDSGSVKGYQADAGAGWWGKLYEEHGRGLLWDRPAEAHVRKNEWNRYEILAVDHRIRTAINGRLCVDLNDPEGDLKGIIAFQLHSGGPIEARFRNFILEADPEFQLRTLEQ